MTQNYRAQWLLNVHESQQLERKLPRIFKTVGQISRIFKVNRHIHEDLGSWCHQGGGSIKRWHLTSIGNPIVEIGRSYDRLISTMWFPILVRWRLYIESGPRLSVNIILAIGDEWVIFGDEEIFCWPVPPQCWGNANVVLCFLNYF